MVSLTVDPPNVPSKNILMNVHTLQLKKELRIKVNRYAIPKIWKKFLIMLWLMKLDKENQILTHALVHQAEQPRKKTGRHFIPLAPQSEA